MNETTVISRDHGCYVTITHRATDPGMWVVKEWKRFWFFRTLHSSTWFTDEGQALNFARERVEGQGSISHPGEQ